MPVSNFSRVRQRILVGVVAFSCVVLASIAVMLSVDRKQHIEEQGKNLANLALALCEQSDASFRLASVMLEDVQREIMASGGLSRLTPASVHHIIARRVSTLGASPLSPIGAIFVTAANGVSVANSTIYPAAPIDSLDRDYFLFHSKTVSATLHISKPAVSRRSGERVVFLSRRLSDAKGNFGGVVVIHLRTDYFNDFFRKIGLGEGASVTLARTDGQGLFRYPYTEDLDKVDLSARPEFVAMLQNRSGWLVSASSPYEGISRIAGYRASELFPIISVIAITQEHALQSWFAAGMPHLYIGFVLLLGLVGMSLFTLVQLRALERAIDDAMHDSLTKMGNRRYFDQRLAHEWNRACRSRSPLSLLYLDIDHFKRYNDALGHSAGDRCLKKVARVLMQEFTRAGDVTARIGGEEFVCLLPDCDAATALRAAENLQNSLRAIAIAHPNSPVAGIVTMSIGVATVIPIVESASATLVDAADEALYRAKNSGRNRVVGSLDGARVASAATELLP